MMKINEWIIDIIPTISLWLTLLYLMWISSWSQLSTWLKQLWFGNYPLREGAEVSRQNCNCQVLTILKLMAETKKISSLLPNLCFGLKTPPPLFHYQQYFLPLRSNFFSFSKKPFQRLAHQSPTFDHLMSWAPWEILSTYYLVLLVLLRWLLICF